MMGAVQIHQLLTKHGLEDIAVSEFESSLFTCRYNGDVIKINAIKKQLGISTDSARPCFKRTGTRKHAHWKT